MIVGWTLLKRSLNEEIFKTKKNAVAGEEKDDTRCDAETTYDDASSRKREPISCYTSYDDEPYDGLYDERAVACITSSTYYGTASDFYIGVDAQTASTVYLPTAVGDGKEIVVKSEMKPPIGKRKITITTTDGSLIDGYDKLEIQVSHDYCHLLYRGGQWRVIGR